MVKLTKELSKSEKEQRKSLLKQGFDASLLFPLWARTKTKKYPYLKNHGHAGW
jgi:hypothetical protein